MYISLVSSNDSGTSDTDTNSDVFGDETQFVFVSMTFSVMSLLFSFVKEASRICDTIVSKSG